MAKNNETIYRLMNAEERKQVGQMMREKYGAEISLVTDNNWHQTAPNVWVAAFCKRGATDKDRPELYMVHYVVDQITDATPFMVYKAI